MFNHDTILYPRTEDRDYFIMQIMWNKNFVSSPPSCYANRDIKRVGIKRWPSGLDLHGSHNDVIKWKHFRVTGHLCGEFTGPRWIPCKRPVTRSFDVFFDLRLNKRLSKQSWGWWFETPSRPLWRHCNVSIVLLAHMTDYFKILSQATSPGTDETGHCSVAYNCQNSMHISTYNWKTNRLWTLKRIHARTVCWFIERSWWRHQMETVE